MTNICTGHASTNESDLLLCPSSTSAFRFSSFRTADSKSFISLLFFFVSGIDRSSSRSARPRRRSGEQGRQGEIFPLDSVLRFDCETFVSILLADEHRVKVTIQCPCKCHRKGISSSLVLLPRRRTDFSFVLVDRPVGPIRRSTCPPGSKPCCCPCSHQRDTQHVEERLFEGNLRARNGDRLGEEEEEDDERKISRRGVLSLAFLSTPM